MCSVLLHNEVRTTFMCFDSDVYIDRLLRAAILQESVMRGDSDSVDKVKEMFADWSVRNARFAR